MTITTLSTGRRQASGLQRLLIVLVLLQVVVLGGVTVAKHWNSLYQWGGVVTIPLLVAAAGMLGACGALSLSSNVTTRDRARSALLFCARRSAALGVFMTMLQFTLSLGVLTRDLPAEERLAPMLTAFGSSVLGYGIREIGMWLLFLFFGDAEE